MSLIRVYRGYGRENTQESGNTLLFSLLKQICPQVVSLKLERCYYLQASALEKTGASEITFESVLGETGGKQLKNILGDSWMDNLDLYEESQFKVVNSLQTIVEIGPRLSFTSAWSTNAVSICHASGLSNVARLERAHRYLIEADCEISPDMRQQIVMAIHDPMTEQEYTSPLKTFDLCHEPESWSQVDVLGHGKKALEEVNTALGLAFDSWDIDYYTDMFQAKVKRNPTTVELFDLAQSNSEHSRHWFFKGEYYVDGEKLPCSLLDMVMSTNKHQNTNQNNVIAFSDNSSGIKGWKTTALVSSDPGGASCFVLKPSLRHLIFTAETHNFPTGVAPFSGATTGTGGRIRDVQAAGRGGHVVAGTAGYCFGNLHIPGYDLPWESPADYPTNFASPLEVAIEASNGASDYGNKFGEPVIAGFARSFGLDIGSGQKHERREWIKPIMFSGGMGTLDDDMVLKKPAEQGYHVVKLGGPVYRIGVGGGAASSVQVQGDNTAARDLGAVQRGDAELEQKLNRVIRGCLEMHPNPILAIHDQGAGGNANVLKELMEGAGGMIFTKSFSVGDPTLSTLEIWGAEYQESNAILTHPSLMGALNRLAARERCPVDVVGIISGDEKVQLMEEKFDPEALCAIKETSRDQLHPVDLQLDWVLGKMPKKKFHWTKDCIPLLPLNLLEHQSVQVALERVLKLPSVASKRYLTNKVDRSVTGLVAQQQCVGPLHTPLADVAVTAHSYFHKEGTATSIGEQPIKMLVDPVAGARLTVLEALANLAAAPLSDIKDVKCSGNWMWAAKLPGEGWALYKACEAMCEIMKNIGVAVDGGKDSLSMAARVSNDAGGSCVVKAPGALVISAYAPCPNVTQVVTPDLKSPGLGKKGDLLWVRPVSAHARLAGSALAQVYSQLGTHCPDVQQHEVESFVAAFNVIQELVKEEKILSLHDISDGGLVTCLLEMGIAGWGGFSIDVPPAPAPASDNLDNVPPVFSALFSEEVGWILEVQCEESKSVIQKFHEAGVPGTCLLGSTGSVGPTGQMLIRVDGKEVVNMSIARAAMLWEETSYQLEKCQMNSDCARAEYKSILIRHHTKYHVPFSYTDFVIDIDKRCLTEVRVALIREEGTNGDREMAAALLYVGFSVYDITMTDILSGKVKIDDYKGIVFPGGFSYADVLGSGVGWAASICGQRNVRSALDAWRHRSDTFSLGVCNGCQLMALLGWLNLTNDQKDVPSVRLVENKSNRFESRWSRVQIESSNSVLLKDMEGAKLGVWVAHGEGQFVYQRKEVYETLVSSSCIALRYINDADQPTEDYPMNPNGSMGGVAAITSQCGKHLAMMPHPERCILRWQWPYIAPPLHDSPHKEKVAAPWCKLFQNGYDWCLES